MGSTMILKEITSEQMLDEGFSERQIKRLEGFKASYPFLEWTENNKQFGRLVFLKWRVVTGRLDEERA